MRFGEVLGFAIYALVAAAAATLGRLRRSWGLALVAVLVSRSSRTPPPSGSYIPMVDRDRVDVAEGPTLHSSSSGEAGRASAWPGI